MARPLSDGRVHRMIVLSELWRLWRRTGTRYHYLAVTGIRSNASVLSPPYCRCPSVDHVFVGHGLLAALLSKGGLQNIGGWFG
jgi:hypothetical protein